MTEQIHERADKVSLEKKNAEIDLSGIQIITSLENLGGIGTSIGDETPIRMSIKIPQFTLEAGVINGWNGLLDGEPVFGAVTALQSPILDAARAFENVFTNLGLQFLSMGGSGIMLDNNGEPVNLELQSTDVELNEETESELRGDITFTLPDGIILEDFQTANGWETVDEVDGRQQITLSLESLVAGDEISLSQNILVVRIITDLDISHNCIVANRLEITWRRRRRNASENSRLLLKRRSSLQPLIKEVALTLILLH